MILVTADWGWVLGWLLLVLANDFWWARFGLFLGGFGFDGGRVFVFGIGWFWHTDWLCLSSVFHWMSMAAITGKDERNYAGLVPNIWGLIKFSISTKAKRIS